MSTRKTLRSLPQAARVFVGTALTFLFYMIFQYAVCAEEGPKAYLKVSIKKIQYNGNDTYSLLTMVANVSSREIQIKKMEQHLFIQTDKGWEQLKTENGNIPSHGNGFLLTADATHESTVTIRIPLTMPDIFRTYEGDISLKYTYRVRYVDHRSDKEYLKADEDYYWITPRTLKWIHREGM
jgi:hypothetical protein